MYFNEPMGSFSDTLSAERFHSTEARLTDFERRTACERFLPARGTTVTLKSIVEPRWIDKNGRVGCVGKTRQPRVVSISLLPDVHLGLT